MKFTKKILQILMLTLGTPILVNNCLAADAGSFSSKIEQTDLQNILTNLDKSKNTGLITNLVNPANNSFRDQFISKENLENIQPVLDVSLSVLKMVAMYYIGQTIMMPAFGRLTGSLGTLFTTPFAKYYEAQKLAEAGKCLGIAKNGDIISDAASFAQHFPKYIPATKLFISRLGTAASKFTQFVTLTMAMAYVQNKLQGEKEAQIS